MAYFSKDVEKEILQALSGNEEVMFELNGKLISIEIGEHLMGQQSEISLEEEIENNQEIKESLYRYIENPDMSKYTSEELKGIRHARRKNF